ncbi:MAG TPA: acetoacetate decarboxylase family protein [Acidimicrobiales bacterium]|nr:acetoacetate decarboxylase family protein [Acidimicrobiales bacterium]
MLSGTASLESLAAAAPVMPSLDPEPMTFDDVEVLQAAFEMSHSSREATLPPGLHPTTPPLMIVLAWRVPESPWGPFTMAQVRVSCRSGVRPRGFVAGCLVDGDEAAAELSSRWGFPARRGAVRLERFYDSTVLDAGGALKLTGIDPDPLGTGDVQYTVTATLAHTPRGLRLVQVEPEYELRRVERIDPRLDHFDDQAWGGRGLSPRHPVAASIGVGTLSIPRLRFVSKPDVTAFEGTETV